MTDNISIYKFENYVLNPAHRELKYQGEPVEIEPRAFDLLVYLVKNRDRAVDKGELQDAVWPGMIVTETALTRAVMKARKAIGDDASSQQMIKTLHGHGYRFVAKLSTADENEPVASPAAEPAPDTEPLTPVKSGLNLRVIIMVSIAALFIAVIAWKLIRPEPVSAHETRIAVLPLVDNTGDQELAWTSFGLMSYASKLLASDGPVQLVPVGSIISLAENFGWSGDLEESANSELLAKLRLVFGATHILAMELETEGNALRMNYSLLGPDDKQQMGTIVGDGGTDLTQGVVQAVYGTLFRKSRLGGDVPLVSEDSFNNEAFARGMDLSLQGRCDEAVQFFRVIIKQEPSLFAPRHEYAACLRILGEAEEAESMLLALVEEQRPLGANRQAAQSLMTLGILYNRTGRLDLAEAAYDEALQISEEIDDHILSARILQNQSILAKSRSDYDKAERLLDLAMLEYQEAGLESLPGQLYSGRANLKMARGELVEAELDLELALKAFRGIGDRRNEAMMLNNTGYLRRRQGRLEEAEAYHLRSLEIREEIGDRVGVGRIYSMLSGVYSARGQYQDAINAAESAIEIARETSDRLFEATSLAQLANTEKSVGDIESARLHYQQSRSIFNEIQDLQRALQTDLEVAELDLGENRLEQAEAISLQVLKTSRENDVVSSEVEAVELLGDIEALRNDNSAAILRFNEALDRVRETSWASKQNTLEIKLANAYMDAEDLDAAAPLVGALTGQQANIQSLKTQARFAFKRGDIINAVELMTKAKTMAGENWAAESEATLQRYLESQLGSG